MRTSTSLLSMTFTTLLLAVASAADQPFLMAIEDVFFIEGRGVIATGRVERGTLTKMEEVEVVGLTPTFKAVVTDIETFRKVLDQAKAGSNVGLLLAGIKKEDLERGQVIAKPGSIAAHTKFKARVQIAPNKDGEIAAPISSGARVQFTFRSATLPGILELPAGVETLTADTPADAEVELTLPVALEKDLAFIIRDRGKTLASGRVTAITE